MAQTKSKTSATLRSAAMDRPARPRWPTRCSTITGAINRPASVDDGTSICDFDEEEKAHKYSIESAVVHFEHAGKHFNVIDTPGYPDFIGQAIGALRAVDTAAIVINAHSGIGVNTRRVFHEAGKAGWGGSSSSTRWTPTTSTFPRLLESIQADVRQGLHPAQCADRPGPRFQGRGQHAQSAGRHAPAR